MHNIGVHVVGIRSLLYLSDALSKCTKLKFIDCAGNQLPALPEALIEKFGSHWAYKTLKNQNLSPFEINRNLLDLGWHQAKKTAWNMMMPAFALFKDEKKEEVFSENQSHKSPSHHS